MSTSKRFSLNDIVSVPWKNGGGTTREIACSPEGASVSNFDWRVSVAEIRSNGAFSIFPNVDRTIALLIGDGVQLFGSRGELLHTLALPNQPYSFPGETQIASRLIKGATSDFNVMTRRGVFEATVEPISEDCTLSCAESGVWFVTQGLWMVSGVAYSESEGRVWSDNTPGAELRVSKLTHGGQALFVSIRRSEKNE